MAGRGPGFNGADFRKQIRFVMGMGAPVVPSHQATFIFANQLVYNAGDEGDYDATGVPFDPSIPVTRVTPPTKVVPCAVEYFDAEGVITDFGMVSPSRAVITLLDDDYAQVVGCVAVMLMGERFAYDKTEFPSALFDVGLYSMIFQAENDV